MKWEKRQICAEDTVFCDLDERFEKPVGILLFGVDCDDKDEVERMLIEEVPSLAHGYGSGKNRMPIKAEAAIPFSEKRPLLAVMAGVNSIDHHERHGNVKMLRSAGAKSVIGIYVRKTAIRAAYEATTPEEYDTYVQHAERLERNPPTADGLDALYVYDSEAR